MSLNFPYTSQVPLGSQQINNTQQPINYNFQDIAQLIAVNHVPFNTPDTFGTHNVVDYYIQSADPTTGANEMALYSKAVTNGNIAELFYRYPNNGTVVQLTGTGGTTTSSQTTSTGAGGAQFYDSNSGNFTGYQYLANGILMKYGITESYFPTTATGAATFSFPVISGIPAFTQTPFHMQFNMNYPLSGYGITPANEGEIYITPISATQFTVNYVGIPYPGGNPPYYNWAPCWMAIGI